MTRDGAHLPGADSEDRGVELRGRVLEPVSSPVERLGREQELHARRLNNGELELLNGFDNANGLVDSKFGGGGSEDSELGDKGVVVDLSAADDLVDGNHGDFGRVKW